MPLLVLAGILVLWGIFAIYSVSIFESFQMSTQKLWDPTNYFYFFSHLSNLVMAIIVAFLIYLMPLNFMKNNSWKMFLFFLILQLLVFTPLWMELQGAKWWLNLWMYTLQPSEFFKLAFLMFFSWRLLKKKNILDKMEWFIAYMVITWILYLMFLKIPDLGTILVLAPVGLMLYWYAWWKIKYIILFSMMWFLISLFIWYQIPYIKKSIDFFINPEIDVSGSGIWWQTYQAMMAIWWWGFLGQGYWSWLQKLGYIPEAQSDFIFAAYSEEMGFIWNVMFLIIFFIFIYMALKSLSYVQDSYFSMLAFGMMSLIFWQAFVNMWVNIKILPLTGLTLPFVSYWWTSLMVNFMEVVLLYKILYNKK